MDVLMGAIRSALQSDGWLVSVQGNVIKATQENIVAQWWLGSRRVVSSLRCVFDLAGKTLVYREMTKEVVKRVPPPTFTRRVWRQSGLKVDIDRTNHGPGGGGVLHYGRTRKILEAQCLRHGWQLQARLVL